MDHNLRRKLHVAAEERIGHPRDRDPRTRPQPALPNGGDATVKPARDLIILALGTLHLSATTRAVPAQGRSDAHPLGRLLHR